MSDILIKGMEMPKDGVYWCEIGVAGEIATITIHGEDRKSFPLVPVPPHGRLIDADALKAEGWELQMFRHDEYGCSITCRSLDSEDIPTIIPAEEGE